MDIAAEKAVDPKSDDILRIQERKRRAEGPAPGDDGSEPHTPVMGVVPDTPAGTNFVV